MSTTRIATLGRERTLTTLARRIFGIGSGRVSRQQLRRAEAALLAANPRLASPDGFRFGASIVVPAVEGLQLAEDVAATELAGDGLVVEAGLRLKAMSSRAEDAFRTASERRKEILERLGDRGFTVAARRALPQAAAHIEKTAERLAREEGQTDEARDRFMKNLDEATAALEALNRLSPKPE